jgi:hypothetical protein
MPVRQVAAVGCRTCRCRPARRCRSLRSSVAWASTAAWRRRNGDRYRSLAACHRDALSEQLPGPLHDHGVFSAHITERTPRSWPRSPAPRLRFIFHDANLPHTLTAKHPHARNLIRLTGTADSGRPIHPACDLCADPCSGTLAVPKQQHPDTHSSGQGPGRPSRSPGIPHGSIATARRRGGRYRGPRFRSCSRSG